MNDDFFKNIDNTKNKNINDNERNNFINGTEQNINFFLTYAKVIRTISFILAGITLLVGLIASQEEIGIFVISLIASIVLVVIALLSTPFLEWKAYTLKNIYEINKSMNKKK